MWILIIIAVLVLALCKSVSLRAVVRGSQVWLTLRPRKWGLSFNRRATVKDLTVGPVEVGIMRWGRAETL